MNKQQLTDMYRSFLAEEGYVPQLTDDGNVTFKYEGGSYLIQIDENDEQFFRVIYPAFWPIESEAEREKVAQAALSATAETKVVKVYPVDNSTWAAIEMFCSPPEVFKSVFQRSLLALKAGVTRFRGQMQA